MTTNITITFSIDIDMGDLGKEPIEPIEPIDLNQPGASFQLDMLHDLLCHFQTKPDNHVPPYDPQRFFVAFLKDFSDNLQKYRSGEYEANQKCRQKVAKLALDSIASEGGMFTHAEIVEHISNPSSNPSKKLPDEYRKKVIFTDSVLRAVGTPWKEIVEDFHSRHPMDDDTKKKLLELGCYPEELAAWNSDA